MGSGIGYSVTYCCQHNSILWNTPGGEDTPEKAIVRGTTSNPGRKRKLKYYSNILVLEDSAAPENEGKVFLFPYGPLVFNFIEQAYKPISPSDEPFDPFDVEGGANFELNIYKMNNQTKYDRCKFLKQSTLYDGDSKKLGEVFENLYSLSEYTDPSQMVDYDTLHKKFISVVGHDAEGNVVSNKKDPTTIDQIPSSSGQSIPQQESTSDDGEDDGVDPLTALRNLTKNVG